MGEDAVDAAKMAAVEKALGEPYMPDFSDAALKVRRNLLAMSLISIAGTLAGVRVAPDSPVFGFHLENLNDAILGKAIAAVVIYMLVHFLWYVIDGFAGWRIRVTGTRLSFITAGTWASDDLDYPNDPRQSTLYNWWRLKRTAIGNLHSRSLTIETSLEDLKSKLTELQAPPSVIENSTNVLKGLSEVQRAFIELKHAIEVVHSQDTSPRMVASLRRFDRWYGFWLRSQNLRWIVLDVGLPLLLGVLALVLLFVRR